MKIFMMKLMNFQQKEFYIVINNTIYNTYINGVIAGVVNGRDCGSRIHWFESNMTPFGEVPEWLTERFANFSCSQRKALAISSRREIGAKVRVLVSPRNIKYCNGICCKWQPGLTQDQVPKACGFESLYPDKGNNIVYQQVRPHDVCESRLNLAFVRNRAHHRWTSIK